MDSNTVFILNEYRAGQAKARRDYPAAIKLSHDAAEAAAEGGDSRGFCRMTFNTADLQLEAGRVEDCIATCRSLLATAAIKEYPDYESQARVLITHALQDKGEMGGALRAAKEAASLPIDELSSRSRLKIQHVLIAALAEDGDTEGAWLEALNLVGMLPADATPRARGIAFWTVGNAAFMSARTSEGLKYHRLATDTLALVNDVSTWALFNKAAAHMRLVVGLIDEATRECLERAEVAFEVAGVTEMDRIEIAITRAWWELESGNAAEAEGLLRPLEKETAGSHLFLQARVLLLLARSLHALGRTGEALKSARQSESIFAGVGADVFASESRGLVAVLQEAQT